MAGIVKGRLLVTLSSSSDSDNSNIALYYRSVYDFLKVQLEPAGYVTEIANGGSSGSATPGAGAFSVWRWNTHSGRTWPWYMLFQLSSGSTFPASRLPATIENLAGGTTRNVGFACAVGIEYQTGSYSYFNPWNGTTGSIGNDSKGNPTWGLTASNPAKERHLCVLPRSNASGSQAIGTKGSSTNWNETSDMMALGPGSTGHHNNNTLLNMWADQDDFLLVFKDATVRDHAHVFMGMYNPIQTLTGVIPAPLMSYRRAKASGDTLFSADTTLANDVRSLAACTIFPFVNTITGSDQYKTTVASAFMWPEPFNEITTNRQLGIALGTTSSHVYDIPPVFLDRLEGPMGVFGEFNSQLLKFVPAVGGDTFGWGTTNSGSIEQRLAFLPADDTLETHGTYVVIWSGSFQPGTGSGVFTGVSGGFRF